MKNYLISPCHEHKEPKPIQGYNHITKISLNYQSTIEIKGDVIPLLVLLQGNKQKKA